MFIILAHLAASEGHLTCLKFIISKADNLNFIVNGTNDQVTVSGIFRRWDFKLKIIHLLRTQIFSKTNTTLT